MRPAWSGKPRRRRPRTTSKSPLSSPGRLMTTASREQVAEQFDDLEQQFHADTMGMWIFLSTELLLFGGVFMGFAINRYLYPEAFAEAAGHLDLIMGAINTAVLLTSGLTMALAEQAVGAKRRRLGLGLLGSTIFLGLLFLCIKGYAYRHEFQEGLVPFHWLTFSYDGAHPEQAQLFFNFYYILTGMHAFHMAVGVGAIAIVTMLGWRRNAPDSWVRQVKIVGLYWAFVDIVWVFVFTSLYLLRA